MIFQAIAILIAQQINPAVIAERHQLAISAVFDVVNVFKRERQWTNRESGHEDLQRRRLCNLNQGLGFKLRVQKTGIFLFQIFFNCASFSLRQATVIEQKFSDSAVKETLNVRWTAAI